MRTVVLVFLAFGGLFVSILSILEKYVKWILSFCNIFDESCGKALKFNLMGIPVSWYGIAYYATLIYLILFNKPLVFWHVMAGFGIELTLVFIMVYIRTFCIYCFINAAMMTGLFLFMFELQRFWEGLSIILLFFMGSLYFLYRENKSEMTGVLEEEDQSVAAKIDGDVITMEELERPLIQPLYNLNTKIYQMKKNHLEQLIREHLIKKEAKEKGNSEKDLVDSFLEKCIKESGQALDERQKKAKIDEYVDSLKKKYNVQVFLRPPEYPIIKVPIKYDPSLGPADALVIIIEFSDYLCPGCRKGHQVAKILKEKYEDRIRWVFKDFPLEHHKGADKMAEAAHCANEQGKFWEYQDILFSLKKYPGTEELITYARDLGLDEEKFKESVNSQKYRSKVEENIQAGKKVGIFAIPTFIINGQLISGAPSPEKFEKIIDEALKKASSVKTSDSQAI